MKDKNIIKQAKLELARRDFFYYCHLKASDFYKEDREFLKELCKTLQDFYDGEDEVLIINMPPRHGKSRTVGMFVEWILGKNKNEKIMTGSYNETVLEKHWDWYRNTMLSRLEENGKIIIIMTRWADGDLAGRAIELYKAENKRVKQVLMKALQPNGTMLCDEILSRKSYESKVRAMGADIASANYQQEPINSKGKLYSSFKTYTDIPRDSSGYPLFTNIKNYTDTADEGSDYLCSIVYGEYQKEAYVLDVYYTKAAMEVTEPYVAKMLYENDVNIANIESNNGGRGFARAIERILREKHKSNKTRVKWFHQSKNKKARIISNATWIMDHVYFPVNWRDRWPEYFEAMNKYQKEGKNKHDDAPDATTGIAEKVGKGPVFSFD